MSPFDAVRRSGSSLPGFSGKNQPLVTTDNIRYNEERKKPMRNELAGDIGLAAGKSQYDAYCKRILANKEILAWILKYAVTEFSDMEIREIKKCIENDIRISKVRVSPGKTNMPEPEKSPADQKKTKCREKVRSFMIFDFPYICRERRKRSRC